MEATRHMMLDSCVEELIEARGSNGKVTDTTLVGKLVERLKNSGAFDDRTVDRHAISNWEKKCRKNFAQVQQTLAEIGRASCRERLLV